MFLLKRKTANNVAHPPEADQAEAVHSKPELTVAPRPDLVLKYQAFKNALHPNVETVYHPCGSNDISPSVAFPDSRVIYAEWCTPGSEATNLAPDHVEALNAAGYEAYFEDARSFNPGPVDIVILLNPTISSAAPVSHLKPGGYALVNNYHNNADELYRNSDEFELVGILHDRTPDGLPILDTEAPESYWETVSTDDELRNSPGYVGISAHARAETGTTTPTISQLHETLERLRKEYPDAPIDDGMLFYGAPGRERFFPATLPRKKGHMGDFFVFRRKPIS